MKVALHAVVLIAVLMGLGLGRKLEKSDLRIPTSKWTTIAGQPVPWPQPPLPPLSRGQMG